MIVNGFFSWSSIRGARGALSSLQPPYRLARLRDFLVDSDPGLLNLELACRGVFSVGLTATLLVGLARLTGLPVIMFAFGAVFSLISVFVLRDLTRRARLITFFTLVPTALAIVGVTSLVHAAPRAGEALFLLLVFFTTLVRTWHPRAMAIGLVAVVLTYVGLYLRLPPASLPYQLIGLSTGMVVVFVVCFFVFPLRPAVIVRRAVRSVMRRAAAALRAAKRDSTHLSRIKREMERLKRAALAAEDQSVLLDDTSRIDIRRHLFNLEYAVRRLVDEMPAVSHAFADDRTRSRFHLATRRLHAGRPRDAWAGTSSNPFAQGLTALTRAASELHAAALHATLNERPPEFKPMAGFLGWRAATQATLASLIAML